MSVLYANARLLDLIGFCMGFSDLQVILNTCFGLVSGCRACSVYVFMFNFFKNFILNE